MKKYRYFLLLGILIISADRLNAVEAVITSFTGNVGVRLEQSDEILPVSVGKLLVRGVILITGQESSAELTLSSGHMIFVDEKTALKIETLEETDAKFNLPKGKLRAKVSKLLDNQTFEVNTPAATCSIRGTEFEVAVNDLGKTLLSVFTGIVEAKELVTGQSVMVGAGQFSSVVQGQPPAEPEALEDTGSDEGKGGQDSDDDRFAEARKEIFEEISKQDVLNQASEDMKNAEYQNGKALIDAFGKRVRLEEYIMRPQADQFKYVVLNKREERFDFGKILFTFNTSLPEDLTTATQNMFQREDEAPAWYPTDILSVVSNTIDTVTEDASGGHPESASSGGSLYYNTVFDTYDFYANSTRLWGYDKTIVPEETYYHGGTAPTSSWTQPDGSTIFHFIGKDTYVDGTWIQADDYIINDDGDVASVSDVVDPSNVSADDIRSRILQMNFERVYTSSLFGDRKIDLVYSAKLLSDAGILNLPSSLSAPSLNLSGSGFPASRFSQAPIRLAKFKEAPSGDIFPEPEMPYEQDIAPKVQDDETRMIQQVASAELLGGQYFVEGDNTSLKGNIDLLYVPVINLSENTAILPIYTAEYRGTKGVEELVGGGTLVQTTMKHALYGKIVHKTESDMTYKGTGGVSGEWLAETEDETLSDGLFNNYRYTLGFEAEKQLNKGRELRIGYDFGITDYINYQALSSDDRFADAGVTSSMGTDVLNFNSHDIVVGYDFPLSERTHITSDYRISYLMFADQKIVGRSGEYASTKRNDIGNTLNLSSIINTPKARLGLGYGLQYYVSNQNAYDADRTHYNEDYYNYLEQKITPSISFLLGKDMSRVSFYWDFTIRNYLDRNVQNLSGDYGTSTINQTTNGFGMWLSYPVFHQVALRMKLNYLMSTSNMKYESTYTYNYDVVNYFIGFGWEL